MGGRSNNDRERKGLNKGNTTLIKLNNDKLQEEGVELRNGSRPQVFWEIFSHVSSRVAIGVPACGEAGSLDGR